MKVITLKQPWATLVAEGIKKYEFRSWNYKFRGEILIHAGAGVDKDAMKKIKHLNLEYPNKKILAIVTIEDTFKLDKELNNKIYNTNPLIYKENKEDGYVWKLTNVRKLDINKRVNGKQGIWNYDLD